MKKRWLVVWGLIVLIVLMAVGFWLNSVNKVGQARFNQLIRVFVQSKDRDRQAIDYWKAKGDGTHTGIMTKFSDGKIYLWNLEGERNYDLSISPVLLTFDTCKNENESEQVLVTAEKATLEEWTKVAEKGYVQLMVKDVNGAMKVPMAMAFTGFPFVKDTKISCSK